MCTRCENEPIEWQIARALRDDGHDVGFDEITIKNIEQVKKAYAMEERESDASRMGKDEARKQRYSE